MVECVTALSRTDWQETQVRTPGNASRRFLGIGSPQSSHSSALSPLGVSARARRIASFTVSSIWSCTAPSRVHPPAMTLQPSSCCTGFSIRLGDERRSSKKWILKRVQDDGFAGGATYGLNAPPGTAEATGLSKPSLLIDE